MAVQSPPFVAQAASHSAALFRQALGSLYWQGGPTDAATLVVSAQSTPNMTVQTSAGQAWIDGTQVANASGQIFSTQGTYYGLNDAPVTLTISTAHPTLPRIDLVCISVTDAQYSGATNTTVLAVVTGTPASTPVAPAAPNNAVVLAKVAVAGAATAITNANITTAASTSGQVPTVAVVNGTPIPFTSSGRPTGTRLGALGYEYDTSRLMLNGASGWAPYGYGLLSCLSSARPSSPTTGQTVYETDTGLTRIWTGSLWAVLPSLHGRVTATGGTIGNATTATYAFAALPATVGPGQFIKGWLSFTWQPTVTTTSDQTIAISSLTTSGLSGGLFDGWTGRQPGGNGTTQFAVTKHMAAYQATVTAASPTISITLQSGTGGPSLIIGALRFDFSTGLAA